jgi:nucleotide-binding universal stress UspA family protein
MAIEPFGPVVVGVDASAVSMAAVDLAAEEALARVAPLLVLHVSAPHHGGTECGDRLEAAHQLVTVAVAKARSEHPGLSVGGEVVVGEPVDALVSSSAGASLLVVGHRGRCREACSFDESVASRVADRTRVPMIVYRPLDTVAPVTLPRPVLLAVENAADSDALVEFAFAEAALRGAPLQAVHVWSAPADSAPIGTYPDRHSMASVREEAEQTLTEALVRWADKYPQVRVHRAVRHSLDVPIALTAASRTSQLAVIGVRHPAGTAFRVLLQRAGCPVAIVPSASWTTASDRAFEAGVAATSSTR